VERIRTLGLCLFAVSMTITSGQQKKGGGRNQDRAGPFRRAAEHREGSQGGRSRRKGPGRFAGRQSPGYESNDCAWVRIEPPAANLYGVRTIQYKSKKSRTAELMPRFIAKARQRAAEAVAACAAVGGSHTVSAYAAVRWCCSGGIATTTPSPVQRSRNGILTTSKGERLRGDNTDEGLSKLVRRCEPQSRECIA
jgi:hypothetical protein